MNDESIIRCEEAIRLLLEHLDGELEPARHREVERHLQACRACWSRADFEKRLRAELSALGSQAVRREFEGRIRTLIGRFSVAPGATPAGG